MSMDVHSRYRTEGAGDVVPRFNERFILSLGQCSNCLVCDDELNVLPLSNKALKKLSGENTIAKGDTGEVLTYTSKEDADLNLLKDTLKDTPHVGELVNLAKTMDQAKAVLTFLEACAEKTSKSTVALTAGRGRGKSAAIGLCLAGALSFGYSNVNVTAPEPENLVAVFDFVLRGLKALKYQEHLDYSIRYNSNKGRDTIKCIVAVEVHRSHRQIIQYVKPEEKDKFASAELVAIDEAAAIPLPIVRALMGDRLTFMSSTVNGYEGTGRALSLKLIKEMRDMKGRGSVLDAANSAAEAVVGPRVGKGDAKVHEQRWAASAAAAADVASGGTSASNSPLREIELQTPIRYTHKDPVEGWLNKLLCLDSGTASEMKLVGGAPAPSDCELFHVDRDALFSYHKLSEAFLQKMMGLYSSAHYKNTPNDLQMLSDAPAHAVFVLLSPSAEEDSNSLPDILAVIQVALEGKISRKAVEAQLARGHRSAGDLIPWTISQQFGDSNFAQLSGARVVRVAVHPSVQGMGYGSRAVELLYRFYNGEMISLSSNGDVEESSGSEDEDDHNDTDSDSDNGGAGRKKGIQGEKLVPRKQLPPLLLPLTDVKSPRLDWLGTSFGLTSGLHRFWRRAGMRMLYLRQTKNELTGEHSAIMVRALPRRTGYDDAWLPAFVADTQRRIISLLGGPFRGMEVKLATGVLEEFESNVTKAFSNNKDASQAIEKRSGSATNGIDVTELNYFLTPHDLKRLELYGRNLCDHHLVADLLPILARVYFTGRLGKGFKLSSLQGALLCAIGLQNKTVDDVTKEIGLPPNQILAMFNKSIRKLSIVFNEVVEKHERSKLLSGEARTEAEKKASKMKDVSHQTLDEDAIEGAMGAMEALQSGSMTSNLPSEITGDNDIMKYAIKGSNEDWAEALKGKEGTIEKQGIVHVKGHKKKRKLNQEDVEKEIGIVKTPVSSKKKKKKSKKSRQ